MGEACASLSNLKAAILDNENQISDTESAVADVETQRADFKKAFMGFLNLAQKTQCLLDSTWGTFWDLCFAPRFMSVRYCPFICNRFCRTRCKRKYY